MTVTLEPGQELDVTAARGHRAPVHGPGTYNGAVLAQPHYLGRERPEPGDVVIHEHGIAGAIIRTHRTYRTSPAGWVYQIRRGDWCEVGYTRTQREALAVAVGRLCRAVDRGDLIGADFGPLDATYDEEGYEAHQRKALGLEES